MAFREVSVVQVREALRRWLNGDGERPIARGVGVDLLVPTPERLVRVRRACTAPTRSNSTSSRRAISPWRAGRATR
jgi:hypothetical protein